MEGIIPYGRQHITQADIDAVVDVLKSDFLTQGPQIAEFEVAFAGYVGSEYAVAVSNGTAALHLASLALNVRAGNKVISTPITFAASTNCVRFCGGEIVFSDIDPDTYLLDIHKVKSLLESAPKGTYQGIIPVNLAGRVTDLEAFRDLANEYDCWLIEDSCHSPGGHFKDRKGTRQYSGNGRFADLSIFSFHPVKHIASGEGGMITTNDKSLYDKLLMLRTHGITKDSSKFINSLELAYGEIVRDSNLWPQWYMEMQDLGYNYRLTDFQAVLGKSQLERAEEGIDKRRRLAVEYYNSFQETPQIVDRNMEAINVKENGHAYHLYIIEVDDRAGLYEFLRRHLVYSQVHYIPLHLMPYYRAQGWKFGDLPNSEEYYRRCLSLPMYPTLKHEEQQKVISLIKEYYKD